MFLTAATNSGSSSCCSTKFRNVTCASAFETTFLAWNSVPSWRATPFTRPRRVTIFATGLLTRISTPRERAADEDRHPAWAGEGRSEEHTSELQSRLHLVCRLLLEKKKKHKRNTTN